MKNVKLEMPIARQFVDVKTVEFVMKNLRHARVHLVGVEKFVLIAVSLAFTVLIAHKFVSALMARHVITSRVNVSASQALWVQNA